MYDFWSIINGSVSGGIFVLIVPYLLIVALIFFIYNVSDTMTLPRLVRTLFITTVVSVLSYATILIFNPAKPLIPNVVITPFLSGSADGQNRAFPFFLSKTMHRAFAGYIHVVDHETVNEVINVNQLNDMDSLLDLSHKLNVHFVVTLSLNEQNQISVKLFDLRYGDKDLTEEWLLDSLKPIEELLTDASNDIIKELYPKLKIEKQDLIQSVVSILPDNEERLKNYIELKKLVTSDKFEEAKKLSESLIKKDTGFAYYYYYLGKSHFELGKTTFQDTLAKKNHFILAQNNLLDAVRRNSANEDFLHELADVYLDEGKFDDASDVIKASYEMDPYHYRVYLNFGRLHKVRWHNFQFMNNEKFLSQTNLIRRAIDLNPFCYEAYYFMGIFLEDDTDKNDAQRQRALNNFEFAAKINPNYIPALEYMWKTSLYQLNFTRSADLFARLRKLAPNNAYAYFLQGMHHYKYGLSYRDNLPLTNMHLDSSMYYFNINIKMNDNPNAHLYLGAIYDFKKDTVNAVKEYLYRVRKRESMTDRYAITAYRRLRELDFDAWRQINREMPPLVTQE